MTPKQSSANLRIEHMPLSELLSRFWAGNVKRHDLATIQDSFSRFGFVAPIIMDEASGKLVAGHGRCETLRDAKARGDAPPERIIAQDGEWLVPVLRGVSFPSVGEASAYGIADNQVGVGAGTALETMWDLDGLADVLQGLQDGAGLVGTGFDDDSLGKLLEELGQGVPPKEEDFDLDAALESQVEPRIKRGEVWQLGRHRLMCGDSTSAEDVAKLMGGEKADIFLTDPPYGISIVSTNKTKGSIGFGGKLGFVGAGAIVPANAYAPIRGDDTVDTAKKAYQLAVSLGVKVIILWGGNYFTEFLPPSSCWVVWDKRVELPSNNFADCEIAWTNHASPSRIYRQTWSGLVRAGSREVEGLKRQHPTQKPVGLFAYCLEGYSERGDSVLDPFLGSGTTIIAAEQLGRVCYGMEIEPQYCEVAIQRWEDYTGQKAVRAE